jgi:uncharacterized glyoxalase superfamily metalloenzyme YdcJ
LRYEDFLPFSAAGIFASNLGQYGTKSTAETRPVHTQADLEKIMGRNIIDPNVIYAGVQAESLLETYSSLGLVDRLAPEEKKQLEQAVAVYQGILVY